jgi:N-acetylmuramoyl-L-alanine amidase
MRFLHAGRVLCGLPPRCTKRRAGSRRTPLSVNSGILEHVRAAFFSVLLLAAAILTAPLASSRAHPAPRQQEPVAGSPAGNPASPQSAPPTEHNAPVVVVLDPAHGGSDSGARGPAGAVESDIVLDFARAIRVSLEGQGFRVLLTREGNQAPSLDSRSALINNQPDAIFISLHVSSTGPIGTARAYWYAFPDSGASPRRGLVPWNQAQQSFAESSRRLAELVQIQLAQKFTGSGETPQGVPVLQLRTVAAPAIAIEISSVAVPDPQTLVQMGAPLAEAVARGAADFRASAAGALGPAGTSGGAR